MKLFSVKKHLETRSSLTEGITEAIITGIVPAPGAPTGSLQYWEICRIRHQIYFLYNTSEKPNHKARVELAGN